MKYVVAWVWDWQILRRCRANTNQNPRIIAALWNLKTTTNPAFGRRYLQTARSKSFSDVSR